MKARKKAEEKKLELSRETLRQLDDRSLIRIVGGISVTCSAQKPCVHV